MQNEPQTKGVKQGNLSYLFCKFGCGLLGNPHYDDLCTRCWYHHVQLPAKAAKVDVTKVRSAGTDNFSETRSEKAEKPRVTLGGAIAAAQFGAAAARARNQPAWGPSYAKLKGSIGEGSNHSNFSHQSSVKILSKFSTS